MGIERPTDRVVETAFADACSELARVALGLGVGAATTNDDVALYAQQH